MPSLLTVSQATFHQPVVNLHIGSTSGIEFVSAISSLGKSIGSAVVTVTLKDDPSGVASNAVGQTLLLYAGWAGADTGPVIIGSGVIDRDEVTSYFPYRRTLTAHGPSFRINRPLKEALRFDSDGSVIWNDISIVSAIMTAQGLSGGEIGAIAGLGASYPMFRYHQLLLPRGQSPQGTISLLDQIGGFWTYDLPSNPPQTTRVVWNPTPAASPVFSLTEGTSNMRDVRVEKHPEERLASFAVSGFRQSQAQWFPFASRLDTSVSDPQRQGGSLTSDYIETDELADWAVDVAMREHNNNQESVSISIPGNPLLLPGVTFAVQAPHAKLASMTNALCSQVVHTVTPSSWRTQATGLIGGAAGGVGTNMHRPAIAIMDLVISRIGLDGGSTIYAVNADGRSSRDVRGYGESGDLTLTYAWTNNKHDASTNPTRDQTIYADSFSTTEYGFVGDDVSQPHNRPRVMLKLTDIDGNVGTAEQLVDETSTILGIQERELWAVRDAEAWCTPNGGAVIRGLTAASDVLCTQPLAFGSWGWFGCENGELMLTKDFLLTWTRVGPKSTGSIFLTDTDTPDAITSVWVHERDSMRITVGTNSGRIWTSPDGGNTWSLAMRGEAPILFVTESYLNKGQVFWAEGNSVFVADNLFTPPFSIPSAYISYGATVRGLTLSFSDHYAFGNNGLVKHGAGTISLPGNSGGVRAFHSLYGSAWVADSSGNCWEVPPGASSGISRGNCGGSVNWVTRDGALPLGSYIARNGSLRVSYDGMRTFQTIDTGNFTMVGYGGGGEKGAITSGSNNP